MGNSATVNVQESSLVSAGSQLGDIVNLLRQLPQTIASASSAAAATGSPAAATAVYELLGGTLGALTSLAAGLEGDRSTLSQVLQAYQAGEAFIDRINRETGTTQAGLKVSDSKATQAALPPATAPVGTGTPPTGTPPKDIGAAERARVAKAFSFFVGKGLTREQAAGLVGNLMWESHMDPSMRQIGGGPGRGIAQWTVTDTRWKGVKGLASERGVPPTDLGVQLDYVWQELNGEKKKALQQLRKQTTVEGAAKAVEELYEVPNKAKAHSAERVANAKMVLAQF